MAGIKSFVWSLGSDNIPLLFLGIGVIMLTWIFYLGDIVLGAA